MRTKMSVAVILLFVAAVAYTAIPGSERTFTQGRGAGSRNVMGGGGAGRGGAQGCSDCDSGGQNRGTGRGNWVGGQSCESGGVGHSCDSGRGGHSCDAGRGGHSCDAGHGQGRVWRSAGGRPYVVVVVQR